MRSLCLLLSPFAFLLQTQEIRVDEIQTTNTQAVLVLLVPDPVNCTVKISMREDLSVSIADTDPALFAGAQDCGRLSSVVDGNKVTFVAGARRAENALDGRFHSRALAAFHKHYFEIQSGSKTYRGEFDTTNIPLGRQWGEPFPFDAAAPGHYAWPSMDWTSNAAEYIDPLTGATVKRLSGPGQAYPDISKPAAGLAAFDAAGNGAWTSASQAAVIDGNSATYAGTSRDPLFVRGPELCPDGWGCERAAMWQQPYRGVDDVEITLAAACASEGCRENQAHQRDIEVCLTVDSVSCATPWRTLSANTTSGQDPIRFPGQFPAPLFAQWREGSSLPPVARAAMATLNGKVSTQGTEVSWKSGATFSVATWKPGSRLAINGQEHVIARVNSATSLTLSTDAGDQPEAAYTANNFGLLVRKSTESADLLEVDGAGFRIATSHEFEMPANGSWDFCSPTRASDDAGQEGFVCGVKTAEGYPTLWFIVPATGEARFLGALAVPYNLDVSGGAIDGNEGACLAGFAIGKDNPSQVYCITRSNASPGQGLLIARGTYQRDGKPGCSQPAGWRDVGSGEACNFTWEILTKPSRGETLLKLAQKFNPEFEPERYPYVGLFSTQGGALGFSAWAAQDTMAWSIWLDAQSFRILSMQNYHANAPCRFCAVHSFLSLGDDTRNAVIVKNFIGGTETNAGPYQVPVTAAAGSSDSSVTASQFQLCPGDLGEAYQAAGARGVNCLTLKVAGEPCDLNPSEWEKAHRPACSWNAAGVSLQEIAEGDEATDGAERFLFVRKLAANQWIVMRNYNIRHGPLLVDNISKVAAHAAGWTLTMACSAATQSGYVWVDFRNDPHGARTLRDNGLSPAEHGDISPLGNVMSGYDSSTDSFGRFRWTGPIPERVGRAADSKALMGKTFAGINVRQSAVFSDNIQTHPSWRQSQAPESERGWVLDGNPFAPQAGGSFTLWRQAASRISGSLYRLGALASPLDRKRLATLAWSGGRLLEDVSGPQSRLTGGAGDHWKYCVADRAGECVEGSAAGQVFLNAPSVSLDGYCGNHFLYNRLCFTSMVNPGIGINQIGASAGAAIDPVRYLSGQFQRYNATWTYDNAVPLPDGSWALASGSLLEGARSDLLLLKLPPFPEPDGIDRSNFIPVKIAIPEGPAPKARVKFGYAENGPPDRYYCTSRREACTSGGSPYSWLSEAQTAENCAGGCTIQVPAVSGRVLYFGIDWLDGSNKVAKSGGRGAVAVP